MLRGRGHACPEAQESEDQEEGRGKERGPNSPSCCLLRPAWPSWGDPWTPGRTHARSAPTASASGSALNMAGAEWTPGRLCIKLLCFNLSGTPCGYARVLVDSCGAHEYSPLARILGLLAGLKQMLWKIRRGMQRLLLCLNLLISVSRSRQPSSRRITCCPSSSKDMFRSSFSQSTLRLLRCLFPPFGNVRDRKFCKKLLCG